MRLILIVFVQRVFEEEMPSVDAAAEAKPAEVREKTRQEREAETVPKFTNAIKGGLDVLQK